MQKNVKIPYGGYFLSEKRRYLSKRLIKLKEDKQLSWHMMETLCDSELHYSLTEAKEKWPEWYQRRVIEKQKPGHWHCNRGMYDWWLNIIKREARAGIRRRCIIILGAYAQKCDISEEEFLKDAYSLVESFDALTVDESNHFRKEDVDSAVRAYREKDLTRMSVAGIQRMTGIEMHRKKSSLSRVEHLEKARRIRDANYTDGKRWSDKGGRPDKKDVVKRYIDEHPGEKSITKIAKETGVSRNTVYKYLDNQA